MGIIKDLAGFRCGRLTVVERVAEPIKSGKHAKWKCVCDCGATVVRYSNSLKKNGNCYCGKCYHPADELSGKKFGRLLVLSYACHKNRYVYWNVRCECGVEKIIQSTSLRLGHTRSCGCLMREMNSLPSGDAAINQLISSYRGNAAIRGLPWSLTREDAIDLFRGKCLGCGSPPRLKQKSVNGSFAYNGIDRINSDLGYVLGNVQTLCRICNFAKGRMSQKSFETYLNGIRLNSLVRPFYLLRKKDVSGKSGTGVVAVGAAFPSSRCVVEWITGETTNTIFENIEQVKRIHGHGGLTEVVWGVPPQTEEELKALKKKKKS